MARQALVVLMVVVAFGILVPLYKGVGFLDPRIMAAYACLALLFVAPASADLAVPEGAGAPQAAIFGKIALIVAWGWGITLLILGSAIVTLNLMARRSGFFVPPAGFLAAILTFSLVASIAIAALGALMARRFSSAQVKTILRTAFLAILLLLIFGSRVLPEKIQLEILDRFATRRALTALAWELSAVFAVIAVLLMVPLLKARGKVS